MPTTDDFLAAAERAAPRFGLDARSVTLLSHSENVVCEVATGTGHRVAMRLHRVGYNSIDELQSEVAWVESLAGAGVRVPTARRTTDGHHYVAETVGDEVRQIGVVEWVRGEPLGAATGADGAGVVAYYERIGEVAAHIRRHAANWSPPPGFVRRAWDLDGLVGDAPLWGRFWEVSLLTQAQRRLFSNCRDSLVHELGRLSTKPDAYGMIHADLHLGNLMADGEELTVIDFDDAGYGWFAHELAVALHPVLGEPWEHDAREALLRGYRAVHALTDVEEQLIDTFLTVRCLMLVGWLNDRRELPAFEFFDELASEAEAAAVGYLAAH